MNFHILINLARRSLAGSERGQTLVEYALIIVFISIGTLAAFTFLQSQIAQVFTDISDLL